MDLIKQKYMFNRLCGGIVVLCKLFLHLHHVLLNHVIHDLDLLRCRSISLYNPTARLIFITGVQLIRLRFIKEVQLIRLRFMKGVQ